MSTLLMAVAAAHVAAGGYAAGCLVASAGRARLRSALAAAQRRACTDPLTGLPNRAGLDAELARRSGSGVPFAVLLADLDGFKPVNDRYGHAAGDAVLVEVGRRLTGLTSAGGFAARLGGDEFVLLTCERDAGRLADDLCRVVASPVPVTDAVVTVGVSVGVARAGPGTPAGVVLAAADVALYRAKTAGRGRVVIAASRQGVAESGRPVARLRNMPRLNTRVAGWSV